MEPAINQRIRAIKTLSPGFEAQRIRLLTALAGFRDLQRHFEEGGRSSSDPVGDAAYAAH